MDYSSSVPGPISPAPAAALLANPPEPTEASGDEAAPPEEGSVEAGPAPAPAPAPGRRPKRPAAGTTGIRVRMLSPHEDTVITTGKGPGLGKGRAKVVKKRSRA